MLDDDERTVLEETERALARDDPDLARRLRGADHPGRAPRRRPAVVVVTAAIVVALLWLGLPGQAFLVVLVGAGVLLGLGWRPRIDGVPTALRPDRHDP